MNFVFSVFFTSLGCISWILSSELFPTAFRARGTSLSTFTNWSANLIIAQCSPLALSKMGYRYFYIFMAFNWAAAATIYFCYPETQGHTLEMVNELFGDLGVRRSAELAEIAAISTVYTKNERAKGGSGSQMPYRSPAGQNVAPGGCNLPDNRIEPV